MNQSNIYKKIIITFIAILIIAGAFASTAKGAFNKEINYQGKLTNASNVAVADGLYDMEFKLYTALSGGTAIWTETLTSSDQVQVTNGLFSVMLGSTTPFTGVDFNQTLYLGVNIESDGEMTPRKILGAVPAAFVADTLDGVSSEQFFRTDAQNATSSTSTFLNVLQTGTGKIAEFFGNVSQSVLAILSNGNIGIGTSTPYAALSIVGSTGVVADHYTATSTQNASVFPYASTTALTVSGTASTTNQIVSNTLTLAYLNGPLQAVSGVVSATSTISQAFGGTGISTLPTYGNILMGNSAGGYTLTATSSLGFFNSPFPFTPTTFGATNANSTSTLIGFTSGLYSLASSTIGAGGQTTGLTISGGATTTGSAYIAGNLGIGTASPGAKLDISGAMVNTASGLNYYRNVATYAPGTSPTGIMKVTLPKAIGSSAMVNITIRGFNYISNANYGEWEVKVAGYDFSSGWHGYGSEISGNPPFSTIRLADDGTSKVILLGTISTAWVSPAVSITDVMVSNTALTGWNTGWGITVVSSETGINNITGTSPIRVGQLTFTSATTTVPISTNTTFNSFYQTTGSQYSRWGMIDPGAIAERATYIQGGYVGSALYYNTLINPLGADVGIGTSTTNARLTVRGLSDASTGNALNITNSSNSSLFMVRNDGNVGVGTTSPYAKLSVTNTGSGPSFLVEDSTSPDSTPFLIDSSGEVYLGGIYDNGSSLLNVGGSVRIGSENGVYSGQLNVFNSSSGALTTAIKLGNLKTGGGSDTNISFVDYNEAEYANIRGDFSGTTAVGSLAFYTNNGGTSAERVRIDNTGNVGIGTTSPYAKLSVVGEVVGAYFTATTTTASTFPNASTTNLTVSGKLYDSASSAGTNGMVLQTTGSTVTWVATSSLGFASSTQIGTGTAGQIAWYAANGASISATSSLFINTSTGYVGIGTTTPTHKLSVDAVGVAYDGAMYPAASFLGTGTGIGTNGVKIGSGSNGAGEIRLGASNALVINATNGISSAGFVNYTTFGSIFNSSAVNSIALKAKGFSSGQTADIFQVNTSADGVLFNVAANGNIGIGTTSPYAKLSVVGQVVGSYFTATTTTASTFPYASTTALSATTLCITTDCRTSWPTSSTFPFTPTTFGSTNANSTSTLIGFTNGIYSLASSTIGAGGQTTGLTISGGATTTGNMYVAGNVGIGTTTPNWKLSVAGDILGNNIIGSYFTATSTTATSTFAGAVGIGTTTPNGLFGVYEYIDFNNTDFNTKVGYQAGKNVVSLADSNTFFGYQAGMGTTTSPSVDMSFNTAVGYQALMNNSSGHSNTALGYQALTANSTGFNNVAIGRGTLDANTTGSGNVGIGLNALGANIDGVDNFAFGNASLRDNVTGDSNIAIGRAACQSALGDNNICIGSSALARNTGSGSIALGYYAGNYETASNSFYVNNYDFGDSDTEKANSLMYGTMTSFNATNQLTVNAKFGVSTTSPSARFAVKGSGNSTGRMIAFSGSTNIERFTMLDNGFTGFGSSTPLAKLSVTGEGTGTGYTFVAANSANTQLFNIQDNGNVGIGTTSPGQKLSVAGDILGNNIIGSYFTATTSTASTFPYASTTALTVSGFGYFGTATTTNLFVSNNANFAGGIWNSSGNVGIGTVSPGSKLHVKGDFLRLEESAVAARTLDIYPAVSGVNHRFVGGSSVGYEFETNAGDISLISIGGFFATTSVASAATPNFSFLGDLDTGMYRDAADTLGLSTAGTSRLHITSAGNVGIGTTSPNWKLSVAGDILGNNIIGSYFTATSSTATSTFAGAVGIGTTTPNGLFGVYEYIDFNNVDLNTKVGYQAGKNVVSTAISNTFFGYQAGMGSSTAPSTGMDLNTAFGYQVLLNNTSGSANTAIGYQALKENSTGFNNVAIGRGTLDANTTGSGNVGLGLNALGANVDGVDNFALGQAALQNNVTGDANVAIGRSACQSALGDNNICIGRSTLTSNTGSGSIAIGYYAGAYETASNTFYVNNVDLSDTSTEKANSLMYGSITGSNSTNSLTFNAKTGISTTSPSARFAIKGAGNTTGRLLAFSGSTNIERLTMLDSGLLGLGTTSPSGKLSITGVGTGTGYNLLLANSSNVPLFTVLDNGAITQQSVTNSTSAFMVLPSGSTAPVLDVDTTNRRVAIGVSATPSYTLDIGYTDATAYSASSITPQGMRIANSDTTANSTAALYFGLGGTGTAYAAINGVRESADNSSLTFRTEIGGTITEGFRLNNAGNFGVGTTTPAAKLALTQSANTSAGGLWIAETGNTDYRSMFMDTSGILSFNGGDTAGALNTATLNAAGAWTNASDRSYKENIEDLSVANYSDFGYGLEAVLKSQPRYYTMKGTGQPQVGFIAQEMKLIIPEVVEGKDGGMGISYGNLVAVAFQAIKDLAKKVDSIFTSLITKKITTDELCVDDVCVGKIQLKQMLLSGGATSTVSVNQIDTTNTAGFAIIKKGSKKVNIVFDTEYSEQPIINSSISLGEAGTVEQEAALAQAVFEQDIRSIVTNKNKKGFTILLNKIANIDVPFAWTATAVKNAKTFESVDENVNLNTNTNTNTTTVTPTESQTASTTTNSVQTSTTTDPVQTSNTPDPVQTPTTETVEEPTTPPSSEPTSTPSPSSSPESAPAPSPELTPESTPVPEQSVSEPVASAPEPAPVAPAPAETQATP